MAAFFRNLQFLALLSLSLQSSDLLTPHVLMARNTLSYRYLALDDSTVTTSSSWSNSSNIIVHDEGTNRYLREYGGDDVDIKWIDWDASEECEQKMNVSSVPTNFYTSPPGEVRGVRIYTTDEDSNQYYVRVNVFTHQVTLECEEAYTNSTLLGKREFEFDLLAIPVSSIP